MPRFDLPNRTFLPACRAGHGGNPLALPRTVDRWRNPDLFWPDDRRSFVATDVDFWSLYIGGDNDFIAELVGNVPTRTELVALDRQVEIED